MDIKIRKSSNGCSGCQREFAHDEPIGSLVRVVEQVLAREDYCADCWNEDRARGSYCTWSLKYYDPKVADQKPPEVFSPLRQLFYEAVECEDRLEQAKAYLAAQLLRRQKVFRRIKESDEADGEIHILLYADRIGNRLIEVRDPNFSYAEMEAARGALLKRLQELESPETTEEPKQDGGSGQSEVACEQ